MAYNEKLVKKIRALLREVPGIVEKKMFGGVGFLLHGNMACGILNDDLIIRVGPEGYQDALNYPQARKFDITGRVMKGWVMVSAEGVNSSQDLANWVQQGVSFARSLPKK